MILRQSLEQCERALGADAPETLDCCVLLSLSVYNIARTREAIALAQRAVDGRLVVSALAARQRASHDQGPAAQFIGQGDDLRGIEALHWLELADQRSVGELVDQCHGCIGVEAKLLCWHGRLYLAHQFGARSRLAAGLNSRERYLHRPRHHPGVTRRVFSDASRVSSARACSRRAARSRICLGTGGPARPALR